MALEFKFPDVGEGIHEGILVKWLVKEGNAVKADQNIAEIETDKAIVEIPSPRAGVLLKVYHKEGETIHVGEVLAVIGDPGEKIPEKAAKEEKKERYTGSVVGFVPEGELDLDEVRKQKQQGAAAESSGILASPKVRKIALELKVNLNSVRGSGPGGKITEEDIHNAAMGSLKKIEYPGPIERIPLRGIRKVTAEHMGLAWQQAAMVTNHDDADATELFELRRKEKEKAAKEGIQLTFVPFIVKAVVESLKRHPGVASTMEEFEIVVKKYYNIGVAIDTPEGLLVPVVKDADKKSLYAVAKDINLFAEKAKTRKIDLADMKGGVFTITNLGAIGTTYFTPIVNYPETCILGTGRLEDKVVVRDGKIVVRKILPLSFTYDHRVVDGAEAARFLNDVKTMLEKPETIPR